VNVEPNYMCGVPFVHNMHVLKRELKQFQVPFLCSFFWIAPYPIKGSCLFSQVFDWKNWSYPNFLKDIRQWKAHQTSHFMSIIHCFNFDIHLSALFRLPFPFLSAALLGLGTNASLILLPALHATLTFYAAPNRQVKYITQV
jgi:hypothetical protein